MDAISDWSGGPTALLAGTDRCLIDTVQGVIGSIENLRLEVAAEIDEVASQIERQELALLLVHVPSGSGITDVIDLLRTVAATRRPMATLVLSDQYHADQALSLLRAGAADYLSRPLDLGRLAYLVDVLTVRVRYAARLRPAVVEQPIAVQSSDQGERFLYLPSAPLGRMMEQVRRVAPQETTVLLSGETGTGKTRLARLIHEISPRRDQPFLVVNCGALSSNLIESEMFGHIKGAFTGADRDRTGKFAAVGRGTLFLDEIDALPLALQAKLLRAVEERVFEPVGSNKSQPVRARLIAASNRVLDEETAAGRFRSDLYYRLNVVAFGLPPLRDRRSVIRPMAAQFLADFAARNGRQVAGIAPDTLRAIEAYGWPGNIRELRNVIERAVALCPGPEVQLDDLPDAIRQAAATDSALVADRDGAAAPSPARTLSRTKEEAELSRITETLEKHKNNRQRAAAELGISRMTLYKKLHKYGLMGAN